MIFKLAPGFSAWAREPLLPKFGQLKMPICVMLGDNDFLTWDGLPEYHKEGNLQPGSTIGIVPDSGHQIQCDNPVYASQSVIEFVFGAERRT